MEGTDERGCSAAKYVVCTLLSPPTAQERTFRFVGGNYSWKTIFSTLKIVQGAEYEVIYKSVEEARENQRNVGSYLVKWGGLEC